MLIPEWLGIFTGDRFGSGANISRSSSHRCGDGGKQASPGRAKPPRWIKSSGTLYFSNSGKIDTRNHVLKYTFLKIAENMSK